MKRPVGRVRWGSLNGLLEGFDSSFQISQLPGAGVSIAQPCTQMAQTPRLLMRVRWGSLNGLLEGIDGGFQISQLPAAGVAARQPGGAASRERRRNWGVGGGLHKNRGAGVWNSVPLGRH